SLWTCEASQPHPRPALPRSIHLRAGRRGPVDGTLVRGSGFGVGVVMSTIGRQMGVTMRWVVIVLVGLLAAPGFAQDEPTSDLPAALVGKASERREEPSPVLSRLDAEALRAVAKQLYGTIASKDREIAALRKTVQELEATL